MTIIIPGGGSGGSQALLDQYFNQITIHVTSCPEYIINNSLIDTLRDFLRRTLLWRSEGVTICTTTPGVATATMVAPPPAGGEFADVVYATDGTVEWEGAQAGEEYDYPPQETFNTPFIRKHPTDTTLVVFAPPPAAVATVTGTVAWVTTADVASPPAFLYRDYRDGIAAGVIADLKAQQSHPWSDAGGAQHFMDVYLAAVARGAALAGPKKRRPLRTIPSSPY